MSLSQELELSNYRRGILELAAKIAEAEEVPKEGEMPAEVILAIRAGDISFIESIIIMAVKLTKKNIARDIRGMQ